MSSGPTMTGSQCIEVTKLGYVNLEISVEDWCTYKGTCPRYRLVLNQDFVCELCKYRKPLDIPAMINVLTKERDK